MTLHLSLSVTYDRCAQHPKLKLKPSLDFKLEIVLPYLSSGDIFPSLGHSTSDLWLHILLRRHLRPICIASQNPHSYCNLKLENLSAFKQPLSSNHSTACPYAYGHCSQHPLSTISLNQPGLQS